MSAAHRLAPSHASGVPGVHVPLRQVSVPLQRSPSAHGVPSGTGACWQPACGSQVSAVHGLPSSQVARWTQAHPSQVSVVQALPSSHSASVVQLFAGTSPIAPSASRRPAPEIESKPGARMSSAPAKSACWICAGVRQSFFESSSAATAAACGAAAEVP